MNIINTIIMAELIMQETVQDAPIPVNKILPIEFFLHGPRLMYRYI